MASKLEQVPDPDEKIRWINREHTAEHGTAPAPPYEAPDTARAARSAWLDTLRRRWPLLSLVGLAILIAAVLAMRALTGGAPADASDPRAAVPLVSVVTPGLSTVTSTIAFTGTVNARYDIVMGVEGEGGRIAAVHVEAGDRVKRGQLLATLDTSVLRPQVTRLAASLAEARANAELRDAEHRRAQAVSGSGALSAEEIERRRAAAVTAAAQVEVAAAQLAEARARLERTELRAPADGVVLTRSAEAGVFPTPGGEPLFRLSRGADIEVRAQLAEQDLPRLAAGQKAVVRLTGIAEPFEGRVRLVGPVIDPETRLGWMRVELAPHPMLRPGAFARGEVTVGTAQRPVLPQTAVQTDASGNFVLVVGEDNRVAKRPVRVIDTGARGVVIGAGLEGDERVVTTAAAFLREGEQVEIARAGAS
ncbi:MAG: efflux RND transporter periplasmic adaptor subunit [Gammaproteobacteria bacterium]